MTQVSHGAVHGGQVCVSALGQGAGHSDDDLHFRIGNEQVFHCLLRGSFRFLRDGNGGNNVQLGAQLLHLVAAVSQLVVVVIGAHLQNSAGDGTVRSIGEGFFYPVGGQLSRALAQFGSIGADPAVALIGHVHLADYLHALRTSLLHSAAERSGVDGEHYDAVIALGHIVFKDFLLPDGIKVGRGVLRFKARFGKHFGEQLAHGQEVIAGDGHGDIRNLVDLIALCAGRFYGQDQLFLGQSGCGDQKHHSGKNQC